MKWEIPSNQPGSMTDRGVHFVSKPSTLSSLQSTPVQAMRRDVWSPDHSDFVYKTQASAITVEVVFDRGPFTPCR